MKNLKNKTSISLGNVCASAVYGLNEGMRPAKKAGYKTCPFDLMATNVGGVIDCIETDFKYFHDPNFLETQHRESEKDYIITHKKYDFSFNHESPYHANLHIEQNWPTPFHYVDDNFKYFVERYEKRVSNFRFYCESGYYYVIFILQFFTQRYSDKLINQLHDAIKNRFPKLEYEIKVIPSEYGHEES